MARVQRANKGTSSADLAEHATGYSGNGESMFSRVVAHGGSGDVKMKLGEQQHMTRLELLIWRNVEALEKIERKLTRETDPGRAGKLARDQQIKMQFIERLRTEQRGQHGTS